MWGTLRVSLCSPCIAGAKAVQQLPEEENVDRQCTAMASYAGKANEHEQVIQGICKGEET
jgi:hypothetical protein